MSREVMQQARDALEELAATQPTAFQGRVTRHSDQSVLVSFPSCRLASEFERAMLAAPPQPAQPAQPEQETWSTEQWAMLHFLYGAGEFDGVWFEQKHPTEKGAFWWRTHLRRLFGDAPQPPVSQPDHLRDATKMVQPAKQLTDEQKFALVEKHLGLERYRSMGDEHLVIDRRTGRYTDAARYFDLIDEAAHGIGAKP